MAFARCWDLWRKCVVFQCFWRLPWKQSMCLEDSKTTFLGGRLNSIKKDDSLKRQLFCSSQSKGTFTRRSLENKTYSRYILLQKSTYIKIAILIRSLPEKCQTIYKRKKTADSGIEHTCQIPTFVLIKKTPSNTLALATLILQKCSSTRNSCTRNTVPINKGIHPAEKRMLLA